MGAAAAALTQFLFLYSSGVDKYFDDWFGEEVPLLDREALIDEEEDEVIYSWLVEDSSLGLNEFTPEVRLRIALIGEAMETLRQREILPDGNVDVELRIEKAKAIKWIYGEVRSEPTFSFADCCHAIFVEVDPVVVRDAVLTAVHANTKLEPRDLIFWLR
jgi:hypothetical protein